MIAELRLHRGGVLPHLFQAEKRFLELRNENAAFVPAQVSPQRGGTRVLGKFLGEGAKVFPGIQPHRKLIGPGQHLFVAFRARRQQNMAGAALKRADELVAILLVPFQRVLLGYFLHARQVAGIKLDVFQVQVLARPEPGGVPLVIPAYLFFGHD